jgi:hypothetical protein
MKTPIFEFNEAGKQLLNAAAETAAHIDSMQDLSMRMASRNNIIRSEGSRSSLINEEGRVLGQDKFVRKFMSLYWDNVQFRSSMIVELLKTAVNCIREHKNAPFSSKVLNWFQALDATSRPACDLVSANLFGPSLRHLKSINQSQRVTPIIVKLTEVVNTRLETIMHMAIGGPSPLQHASFSVCIDATKLAKIREVSCTYTAIMGGCFPRHFIAVNDKMTKNELQRESYQMEERLKKSM